jgi:hypothetical protein
VEISLDDEADRYPQLAVYARDLRLLPSWERSLNFLVHDALREESTSIERVLFVFFKKCLLGIASTFTLEVPELRGSNGVIVAGGTISLRTNGRLVPHAPALAADEDEDYGSDDMMF